MYTIQDALKSSTNYPIAQRVLDRIAVQRDIDITEEFTKETAVSQTFQLAEADVIMWVSNAPDVNEGGVQIILSQEERKSLKQKAMNVYKSFGDNAYIAEKPIKFGYKGSNL